MALLKIEGLSVSFGGVRAMDGVNLQVAEGAIHGMIGPNGAGKTTLLNCVSRLLHPSLGSISFGGRDLLALPPHGVVGAGIARTFQSPALCRDLSALDNVLLGFHHRPSVSTFAFALRFPSAVRLEAAWRKEALDLLARVGCGDWAAKRAALLPQGVQKRVALAQALVRKPRLLVLDEPVAGLNAGERAAIADLIRGACAHGGATVLLVEHDIAIVRSLCDRVTVLDFGRVIAEGAPREVEGDAAVVTAYLGAEGDRAAT